MDHDSDCVQGIMVMLTSAELEERFNVERSIRFANPIDNFVLFVVGAHAAGKDTILGKMQELRREPGDIVEYGAYTKLEYWTDRQLRVGEDMLKEPGAISKKPEEFIVDGQKYLAWYRSGNGSFYAFPPELFPKGKDPTIAMVHVATDTGLQVWRSNKTLPNNITAFINVPSTDDRKLRVRSRLADAGGNISDENAFKQDLAEMSRINTFFQSHHDLYDVMYNNSNPGDKGIRKAIYGDPQESVQRDIALRINALCHLHRDASMGRSENGISVASLCDLFIQKISSDLFGRNLEHLESDVPLEGHVQRAVMGYAEPAGLDPKKLYSMLEKVAIHSVDLSPRDAEKAGKVIVNIKSQHHIPTSLAQLLLKAPGFSDYHVLRILAQRIYTETKTRPEYLVNKNGNLVGLACSLTDQQPRNQQSRQYHRLEIRLGYN